MRERRHEGAGKEVSAILFVDLHYELVHRYPGIPANLIFVREQKDGEWGSFEVDRRRASPELIGTKTISGSYPASHGIPGRRGFCIHLAANVLPKPVSALRRIPPVFNISSG